MSCRMGRIGVGVVVVSAFCVVLSGCGRSAPQTAARPGSDELVIGVGITEGSLTIFPVSTKRLRSEDRFITLDEGLKEGMVEVQELNAAPAAEGASTQPAATSQSESAAPRQPAINAAANGRPSLDDSFAPPTSARSQSAQVNQLAVINRSERALSLVIDQAQAAADSVSVTPVASTPEKAVEESARGKFVATVGNLGKHGRIAVQDKANQSEVWSEVAQENQRSG